MRICCLYLGSCGFINLSLSSLFFFLALSLRFLPMVDHSQMVFLKDANKAVISLPPLTNSELSKVSYALSWSSKLIGLDIWAWLKMHFYELIFCQLFCVIFYQCNWELSLAQCYTVQQLNCYSTTFPKPEHCKLFYSTQYILVSQFPPPFPNRSVRVAGTFCWRSHLPRA